MAKKSIVAGATSETIEVLIQNSSSTTGAGLTGLVFNTSGLTAYYVFRRTAPVAITLATLAAVTTAYSSGGFKEIDSVNMPGVYRLDLPNAALAAGNGRSVLVYLQGAANMAPCVLEIELTGVDNQDAVRFGLSGIPNASAGAVGGLPLAVDASGRVDVLKVNGTSQTGRDIGASVLLSSGTGTGQLDFTSGVVKANAVQLLGTAWLTPNVAGTPDVNAKQLGGTAQTGRDVGASVLLSAGTGAGQLDFTSGVVKANLVQILATALTETAGQIAAAFKKLFDVASPVLTCLSINQGGDNYARIGTGGAGLTALGDARIANLDAAVSTRSTYAGGAVASVTAPVAVTGDFSATMKTSLNAATPASVQNIDVAALPAANADKLLGRSLAGGADGGRTVKDALRALRNKVTITGGTMTVTAEDDSTSAWTAAVTTDGTALPITGVDPA